MDSSCRHKTPVKVGTTAANRPVRNCGGLGCNADLQSKSFIQHHRTEGGGQAEVQFCRLALILLAVTGAASRGIKKAGKIIFHHRVYNQVWMQGWPRHEASGSCLVIHVERCTTRTTNGRNGVQPSERNVTLYNFKISFN